MHLTATAEGVLRHAADNPMPYAHVAAIAVFCVCVLTLVVTLLSSYVEGWPDNDKRTIALVVSMFGMVFMAIPVLYLNGLSADAAEKAEAQTVRDVERHYDVRIEGDTLPPPAGRRTKLPITVDVGHGDKGTVEVVYRADRVLLIGVDDLRRDVARDRARDDERDARPDARERDTADPLERDTADPLERDERTDPAADDPTGSSLERVGEHFFGRHSPLGELLNGDT